MWHSLGGRTGLGNQVRWNSDAPRVLLAEDDPDMRTLVARGLRLDGYQVVEASNGAELFGLLEGHLGRTARTSGFDLVVSDIRMPSWSGLEILAHLRAVDPHTPVILMTAFASHETRRVVEAFHAVLFDKPFELDDLRTAVLNLLDH